MSVKTVSYQGRPVTVTKRATNRVTGQTFYLDECGAAYPTQECLEWPRVGDVVEWIERPPYLSWLNPLEVTGLQPEAGVAHLTWVYHPVPVEHLRPHAHVNTEH